MISTLRVYLDECVPASLLRVFHSHSCDTLFARRSQGLSDEDQLVNATALNRLLFSQNQRHFRLLHRRFLGQGRSHSGIILLPQTLPFTRLRVRAGLLIEYVSTFDDQSSRLYTWSDLQARLTRGYRPPGSRYSEDDVRHALGWQ